MSSFSGVLALAGDPESAVAATVEIDAGMLTLNAGGSEIGAWSLEEIEVEQTAQSFNLHADGEDLVLTTPDMAAFADAVGVAADVPTRKRQRRGDAGSPKGEKRRRFGFRSGRDKTGSADSGPAPSAVAMPPPPPAPVPIEDQFAAGVADPMAGPSLEVDEPSLSPPADLPGQAGAADSADAEPAFSTAPEVPTFPTDGVPDEDFPSASAAHPASTPQPEPEPIVDGSAPTDAQTNESSNRSSLMDAAALLSRPDLDDAEEGSPLDTELKTTHGESESDPASALSFPPVPVQEVDPEPDPLFDALQPAPTAEPAIEFATPEPTIDPTAEDSTAVVELQEPTHRDLGPAPDADVARLDPWADESLAPATDAAPADDGLWAVGEGETSREPAGRWPQPDTPTDPDPTGRWPQPDTPTDPYPTPPVAETNSESVEVTPVSAEQAAPLQEAESAPVAAEVNPPPAELAAHPPNEVPDAARRDVPAIAGIAAVATPDRYVTVPPVGPAAEPATPPEHGADMASEEELSAWIADVNGDGAAAEDKVGAVVPSRFATLRHRSAENYSDENVLSMPLTMAMVFTAIALALATLLSWGIYELSDAFPVERLVSAVAALAVAGGAYLGFRQDRRIAGSITALGGGILALAAVYLYAREAEIGIGYLLGASGSAAAVVLGIVGVTRFGHGPDPRIRE